MAPCVPSLRADVFSGRGFLTTEPFGDNPKVGQCAVADRAGNRFARLVRVSRTTCTYSNNFDGARDDASIPCHTGIIVGSGQVIEGHVPAAAVAKLVAKRTLKGVAVPGLPMNSPGMGKMDGTLVTVDFSGNAFFRN